MIEYKVSHFTIVESAASGQVVLFNTLSRAVAVLPAELWTRATAAAGADDSLEELVNQGFLVESGLDETLILQHFRNKRRYDIERLKYLVHLTGLSGAGARFKQNHGPAQKEFKVRLKKAARKILDFLQSDISNKRPSGLDLYFYGVERAVEQETMLYILEGATRFCQGRQLDVQTTVNTEGKAAKADLIRAVRHFGLKEIVVYFSISGAKGREARLKGLLDKLVGLADLTSFHFHIQYDPTGRIYQKLPFALEQLLKSGLSPSINRITFGLASRKIEGSICDSAAPMVCRADEEPQRSFWIADRIIELGLPVDFIDSWLYHCPIDYHDTGIIDLGGAVAVCPLLRRRADFQLGHVWSGVDFRQEAQFIRSELPLKCQKCSLAPLCGGGCRLEVLLGVKEAAEPYCLKEVYSGLIRRQMRVFGPGG